MTTERPMFHYSKKKADRKFFSQPISYQECEVTLQLDQEEMTTFSVLLANMLYQDKHHF